MNSFRRVTFHLGCALSTMIVLTACSTSTNVATDGPDSPQSVEEPSVLPFQDAPPIFETEWFRIEAHEDWQETPSATGDSRWSLPTVAGQQIEDGILIVGGTDEDESIETLQSALLADLEEILGSPPRFLEQATVQDGARELGRFVYVVDIPTELGATSISLLVVSSAGPNSTAIAMMAVESSRFDARLASYEENLFSLEAK